MSIISLSIGADDPRAEAFAKAAIKRTPIHHARSNWEIVTYEVVGTTLRLELREIFKSFP